MLRSSSAVMGISCRSQRHFIGVHLDLLPLSSCATHGEVMPVLPSDRQRTERQAQRLSLQRMAARSACVRSGCLATLQP